MVYTISMCDKHSLRKNSEVIDAEEGIIDGEEDVLLADDDKIIDAEEKPKVTIADYFRAIREKTNVPPIYIAS